jgi:hypothetical protein
MWMVLYNFISENWQLFLNSAEGAGYTEEEADEFFKIIEKKAQE